MVSGSHDHTLRVWDLATGETKTTLHGHIYGVNAVAVTPDGRHWSPVRSIRRYAFGTWQRKKLLKRSTAMPTLSVS